MTDQTSVSIAQRSIHHVSPRRIRRRPDPKLPVVNVNPFMSEREDTWCKDKSLPEFYERPDVVHESTESFIKPPPTAYSTSSDSMLTTRENRPILPLAQSNKPNLEAANVASSPPKNLPAKVKLFEEPPPIDIVRGRKLVFPPTPRDKCITPDMPIKRLPKHGFAPTIVDRESKTVVDSPTTKPTSLLNRERTQDFVNNQQVLRLRGLRMIDGGRLAPAPSTYLTKPAGHPMKSLEEFYRQLVTSYNRGYAFSPIKSRYSPNASQFDYRRYQSDPLLSLNHESVSERLNSSMDCTESKSAFRILESAGKPTFIEKNLARDYTMSYETNKQGSSTPAGHHFTRFLKLKNYNPTQGELFIMVNKEQNRPGQWPPPRQQLQPQQRSNHTSAFAKSETWYISPDERDIPVSPDMTSLANNELLAHMNTARDSIDAADDKHQPLTEHAIEEDNAGISDQMGDEKKTPERLEITTTLPDINSNNNIDE